MNETDRAFVGSVPEVYDRFMGPMLFEPQARHLAQRYAGFGGVLLETAAGTGRLTQALAEVVAPSARITATDLNEPMLARAAAVVGDKRITWQQTDALALPFAAASFDEIVCQFGVMFFPDKGAGFAEARRVLRPEGAFRFNVWDDLEANDFCRVMTATLERDFPQDPPGFLKRGPFSYHNRTEIGRTLKVAGFSSVEFETVVLPTPAASADDAATGICRGSPLAAEIEGRDPGRLPRVVEAVASALRDTFGSGPISGLGQALLVTARP